MGARVWSLRFAPINPLGLIAQLLARLLDIHSRLSKLLMLGRLTSCWSAAANRAGWSWMLSISYPERTIENQQMAIRFRGKFAFCHSSTSIASVVFRKSNRLNKCQRSPSFHHPLMKRLPKEGRLLSIEICDQDCAKARLAHGQCLGPHQPAGAKNDLIFWDFSKIKHQFCDKWDMIWRWDIMKYHV